MVRHLHHTKAAVAITIALSTALTPTASADPAQLTRAEAVISTTHHSALVLPNPDQQTATATPTSSRPCSEICSGGAGSHQSRTLPAQTPPVVRVVAHSAGFHWADAAIGAGVTILLLAAGLAGVTAATNSRKRHLGEQRAIATHWPSS
jgi:hypothetical protein